MRLEDETKEPVILSGHFQQIKNRMIGQRFRYGWKCYVNRYTGIRHIWMRKDK